MLTYAIWAFAAVFMLTGIFRVVEFKAADVGARQRKFLIPLHVLGCAAFTVAIALLGLDPGQTEFKPLMTACFMTGLFILFPLHIYVAIKRRIKMNK